MCTQPGPTKMPAGRAADRIPQRSIWGFKRGPIRIDISVTTTRPGCFFGHVFVPPNRSHKQACQTSNGPYSTTEHLRFNRGPIRMDIFDTTDGRTFFVAHFFVQPRTSSGPYSTVPDLRVQTGPDPYRCFRPYRHFCPRPNGLDVFWGAFLCAPDQALEKGLPDGSGPYSTAPHLRVQQGLDPYHFFVHHPTARTCFVAHSFATLMFINAMRAARVISSAWFPIGER